jgi:diacylglycerol kinase (ATP)
MLIVYNKSIPEFNLKNNLNKYKKHNPDFFSISNDNDKYKLKKLINKKNYKTVVVIGGDGTVNLVASLLVNKNIKLAIIPRGSTNGLFYDLSKKELPLNKRKIKYIDVIKINNEYCFHLAGFGLNAHIIKESKKNKLKGFLKYVTAFFKSFFKFKKYAFKINDKVLKKRWLIIANGKSHGSKFKINPNGKINDGKFEICTLKEEKSYNKAKIINKNNAPFHIDGEFKGHPKELNITIKKESLKLLI